MPILSQLIDIYKKHDHHIVNGIHPKLSGLPFTEFTHIIASDNTTTRGLGISPSEVYFLEHLFEDYSPKSIFVVGNSFAWSTFALALLNPQAKTVALDACLDKLSEAWIEETNRIAAAEGLSVVAEQGVSPQDVPGVVERNFPDPVDFVFIDGDHTNKQVALDFEAIRAFTNRETIFLFHDVLYWDLQQGVASIRERTGMDCHVLWRTSSGMCLLCHDDCHKDKLALLENYDFGLKTKALYDCLKQAEENKQTTPEPVGAN